MPDLGLSVGDPALAGGFYTPVRDEMLYFLAIRTTADPQDARRAAASSGRRVDPDLQLEEIVPLEDAGIAERAFLVGVASALTAMGGMALLLSIVGIYALLSFMVTRRTREIGIRVALGATQPPGADVDHRRRARLSRHRRTARQRAGRGVRADAIDVPDQHSRAGRLDAG